MDNILEKGCNKKTCPFNDGYMCTNTFGCMCYEVDFLNSNIGTFNGELDKNAFNNFIR